MIAVGTKCRFNYPEYFSGLPEYAAHRAQNVTVIRALSVEGGESVYEVRAEDGWSGHAYETELAVSALG